MTYLGDGLQELGIAALGLRVVLHVLPRSFGVVRKAVRKSDQMVVAIKTLRGFVDAVDMIREVDLVANLHHPNIIRLLDVCRAVETNQRGALVFEYGGPTLCWHPLRPIVATHQTLVRYNVGCKFLFAHQFPNEGAQVSGFCIRVSRTWGPTLQELEPKFQESEPKFQESGTYVFGFGATVSRH
jgi:hypothetical protein